ncbi:hypothetical protein Fmac_032074 [Flemingia macrophylla]|uniref:Uncharacterized protein n=1 Tax=Flemingia macrophylla TaxID=520843 RepID=A0ABD1L4A4_9FABA
MAQKMEEEIQNFPQGCPSLLFPESSTGDRPTQGFLECVVFICTLSGRLPTRYSHKRKIVFFHPTTLRRYSELRWRMLTNYSKYDEFERFKRKMSKSNKTCFCIGYFASSPNVLYTGRILSHA